MQKGMEILWLTHTVSAISDYYFHENDKLTVFTCHPQNGWWDFRFYYKTFISSTRSAWIRVCEDASLVSLDIWLPFYPVPRIVSQMLCDRSTPSYQSSFTLTQPQLHKDTSSSSTLKMISYKIQVSPARLKAGICLLKLTRQCCIKSPSYLVCLWVWNLIFLGTKTRSVPISSHVSKKNNLTLKKIRFLESNFRDNKAF